MSNGHLTRENLAQLAFYAGWPAAVSALNVLHQLNAE